MASTAMFMSISVSRLFCGSTVSLVAEASAAFSDSSLQDTAISPTNSAASTTPDNKSF